MTEYTYCGSCGARNDQKHYKNCVLNQEMNIFQKVYLIEALFSQIEKEGQAYPPEELIEFLKLLETLIGGA